MRPLVQVVANGVSITRRFVYGRDVTGSAESVRRARKSSDACARISAMNVRMGLGTIKVCRLFLFFLLLL